MLKKKTLYSIVFTTICSYGFMHTNIVTGTTNPTNIETNVTIVSPPAIDTETETSTSTEFPLYKLTSSKPTQAQSKTPKSRSTEIDAGFGNRIVAVSDINLKKCIIHELNKVIQEENETLKLNQPLIPISANPTDSEVKKIIITQEQANKLTTLFADHKKIYNLAGLEFFRNLENVNLGNNPLGPDVYDPNTFQQFSDPLEALGKLPKLKSLDLINCNIEDISALSGLSQYGQITTLSLSNNYISDLTPLAHLTSLKSLDLYYNFVSNVKPLSDLVNLEFLDLGNNYDYYAYNTITTIKGLSKLINLKYLNLEHAYYLNNIEPLRNLTALEKLNLNYCAIGDTDDTDDAIDGVIDGTTDDTIDGVIDGTTDDAIDGVIDDAIDGVIDDAIDGVIDDETDDTTSGVTPLYGLTSLQELYIDSNYISKLILTDLPNLRIISAEGNPLDRLEIKNADHLKFLNLDFTEIRSIKLTNVGLEVLELESEALTHIELRNLTKLKELRLVGLINLDNYNFLKYLPRLEALDMWNIPFNQPILDTLSVLDNPTNLKYLSLGNNKLTNISFISKYTGLNSLTIQDNPITSVEAISTLPNLTQLYIYRSNISNITPLTKIGTLEHLSLKGNKIATLPKDMSFPALTGLNLSHNRIQDISSLGSMKQLEYLELSHNQITDISALQSLTKLNRLNLRHNQIQDMTPIHDLPELEFRGDYTWYWIQENPYIIPPQKTPETDTDHSKTETPVSPPPVVAPPMVFPPMIAPPTVAPTTTPAETKDIIDDKNTTKVSTSTTKSPTNIAKVHTQSSNVIKNKLSAKVSKKTLYLNSTSKAKTTEIKTTLPKNYTVKYFNCSPKLIALNKKTGNIKALKAGKAKIKVNFYYKKKWVKTQYITIPIKQRTIQKK